MKSLTRVQLFATPWTVTYQAPPSMGFSRQEYWSGLPFPSPGDLPDPGIKPRSPAWHADALPSEPPGKLHMKWIINKDLQYSTGKYIQYSVIIYMEEKPGEYISESVTCSVLSNFLRPHGLLPARFICPWNSPGKNTAVSGHSLLQELFQNQRWNPVNLASPVLAGRFFTICTIIHMCDSPGGAMVMNLPANQEMQGACV